MKPTDPRPRHLRCISVPRLNLILPKKISKIILRAIQFTLDCQNPGL